MKLKILYYRYHDESSVQEIRASHIPYYDLTLVLSGRLLYRINNRALTLREGAFVLMPPGSKRERFALSEQTTYVSFNFTTDDPVPLPLTAENALGREIPFMIHACNEIHRDADGDSAAAFESLTQAVISSLLSSLSKNKNSDVTTAVLSFIRAHYASKLTLRAISGEVGYSPTYCDAVFKKDVGESIVRYLIDYRIEKAKEFLIENVLSLSSIAERTGFSDPNYFSRQFRRRTGVSPAAFRKRFNK